MRFLILDTYYPAFLLAHRRRHPGLERRTYDEQWRALMNMFFGTADSYSHALGQLGHDAHEVVANSADLQTAWLRDRGRETRLPFRFERERILEEQARELAPDVVYVQNLQFFSSRLLGRLRRRGAVIVGQIASELPRRQRLHAFDLIVTSFPHYVERFRKLGVPSEYLRIGFDSRVLARLESQGAQREQHGAVFVGALNRTHHRRGNAVIEAAARRTKVEFWGYDARGWKPSSPIRRNYRGEAWGIDMFRVLYESQLTLNRHIAAAAEFANNMRLYEATGVGSLIITDEKSNLSELFVPGVEVVTYRDADELVAQIDHFLAHDEERRAVSRAGQARTMRDHTYAQRMEELLGFLGESPRI